MDKGKDSFLDKWIRWLNKGKNRYMALCVLCVVVIILLLTSVMGNVKKMQVQGLYPDGELVKEAIEHPGYTLHKELTYKALFPYSGYSCYLPTDSVIKNDAVVGTVDDILVVAISTEEDEKTMCEEQLHLINTMLILGSKPEANLEIKDNGYFYDKKANYYAYTVGMEISTRKQVIYTMCYVLTPEGQSEKLYLYVSTEDKEKIDDAYNLLWNIALSVNVVEDVDKEIKEGYETTGSEYVGMTAEEAERIEKEYAEKYDPGRYEQQIGEYRESGYYEIDNGYEIYVELQLEESLKDGVFHMYWTNSQVSPYELYVENSAGERYYPYAAYTVRGNYVFSLGACEPDTYYLKGTTPAMFDSCFYYFTEMEQYKYLYLNNEPIPREG